MGDQIEPFRINIAESELGRFALTFAPDALAERNR